MEGFQNMNILIIEDELAIQHYLAQIIKDNYPHWTVNTCSTYEQGLSMASDNTYNLFIIDYELDINDSSKNGIALGQKISTMSKYRSTPIIFETSYSEHIFNAVNTLNCVYYLIKPYDTAQVMSMLKKIIDYIPLKKTLSLKDEYGISAYIHLEDIIYVESNRHKLTIYMPATIFVCTGHSLETLAELCGGTLIRCHKSFLVNKAYISHIDAKNSCVDLKHPSSHKTYIAKLGRAYQDYIQMNIS